MGLKGDTWSLALHQPDNKDRHKFAPSFSTLPSRLVNLIDGSERQEFVSPFLRVVGKQRRIENA